jgi:hypothetical protein
MIQNENCYAIEDLADYEMLVHGYLADPGGK